MEVYLGEEYCGTSRGKNVCNVLDNRFLLSFGEKNCVFISKVVVHVRPVSAHSSAGSPALGSRIDLERVQTIMESMGSKLSPGAQQLMNMVRFQQQKCVRVEEQPLCSYLEKILSKNMELMEKKLTDYIDQRIYKLQEHIDNKIAFLMGLLQRPNSPPSGMPLRHYDSGEGLSNGER
ncbi:hypothetical protein Celaphus_00008765, partial [Cervus elaphus hippelaphus]